MSKGELLRFYAVGFAGILIMLLATTALWAHDHARPDLDSWYPSLNSRKGPCCDGPRTDALHLQDVDWQTQEKDGSHFRVRIPKTGPDFQRAVQGESVETEWVDVPDEAVVHEVNRAGIVLVWPMYGYMGKTVRCFLPGTMA